jgi:hypothetical protein
MIRSSSRPRSSRTIREKRKELFLGATAKVMGSLALILAVAAVFRVVVSKLWEMPAGTKGGGASLVETVKEAAGPGAGTVRAVEATKAEVAASVPDSNEAGATEAGTVGADAANGGEVKAVPKAVPLSGPVEAEPAAGPVAGVAGIEAIGEKRGEIGRALKGFFGAETVEEKLKWSRDAGRVAGLMTEFYNRHKLVPRPLKELGWVRTVTEPGFRFGYAEARLEDGEAVPVIVEEVAGGRMVVDWESAVRYGEMTWTEWIESRPERPILQRVLATKMEGAGSAPMAGAAPTEGVGRLLLRHPASEETVEAVYDGADPMMAGLTEQLEAGRRKDVPVTLRLSFPGVDSNSNAKTARITAVEGRGWLILPQKRS